MSYLVVVLLSVLWLGFFLPSLLQARRSSSPYSSATTFQDSLRRLGAVPATGETQTRPSLPADRPMAPRVRPVPGSARRRDVLAVLAAATAAGAIISLGFGGLADWAVAPPLVALVADVFVLRRDARRRAVARGHNRRLAVIEEPSDSQPAPDPTIVEMDDDVAPVVVPDLQVVVLPAEDAEIIPSVARRALPADVERIAG